MCTTRKIDDQKGWLYLNHLFDQTEWTLESKPRATLPTKITHGHGELFNLVCVEGPNDCAGTYYFEGEKLRFNGGVANGAYTELEKIAD